MTTLNSPRRDLDIAASEIKKMKQAAIFSEFQESWENFLFRVERAWEVTERILKNKPGFSYWHQPYSKLRKKDSLLIFLKHARNSEMHCVTNSVEKSLELSIKDKTGLGLAINSIVTKLDNGTLTIDIKTPDIIPTFETEIVPTAPKLVKVKSRGKWYNPPKSHLNKRISNTHPVTIAELGLEFYRSYVTEAEHWLSDI